MSTRNYVVVGHLQTACAFVCAKPHGQWYDVDVDVVDVEVAATAIVARLVYIKLRRSQHGQA